MVDPIAKLIDAVMDVNGDDIPPRLRDLARTARTAFIQQLAASAADLTPADPMTPTVAVPRDLLDGIVYDLRQGLCLEPETVDALAELLEGGAA